MNEPMSVQPDEVSPWYRSAMLWFALALPAATVVAGVLTYRIAAAGSNDADPDLVQRVAQVQTRDITIDQRASDMGLRGVLVLEHAGGHYRLRLTPAPKLARLRLHLRHVTQARGDQQLMLAQQSDGSWMAVAPPRQQGAYALSLLPEAADWRLVGVLDGDAEAVQLHPLLGTGHD
jgi:uncharacterized protein